MIVPSLVTAIDGLLDWLERRRQRHALLRLDERLLKDIGASRCDAEGGRRDR